MAGWDISYRYLIIEQKNVCGGGGPFNRKGIMHYKCDNVLLLVIVNKIEFYVSISVCML